MDSHTSFLTFPPVAQDWNSTGEKDLERDIFFCTKPQSREDPGANLNLEEDYKHRENLSLDNPESSELR